MAQASKVYIFPSSCACVLLLIMHVFVCMLVLQHVVQVGMSFVSARLLSEGCTLAHVNAMHHHVVCRIYQVWSSLFVPPSLFSFGFKVLWSET
eukprot:c29814_g1_i1 orf=103-381(-)